MTKHINIAINEKLRQRLRKIAFDEDRSMTSIVKEAIELYVEQQGFNPRTTISK